MVDGVVDGGFGAVYAAFVVIVFMQLLLANRYEKEFCFELHCRRRLRGTQRRVRGCCSLISLLLGNGDNWWSMALIVVVVVIEHCYCGLWWWCQSKHTGLSCAVTVRRW